MAWLIGLIILIVCLYFWRVTLPVLGIAALALGVWIYSERKEQEEREQKAALNAAQIRSVIAAAQENPQLKKWQIKSERDPASGQAVPRIAAIQSDDGLCTMQVEQRITGARLTGIYCYELDINSYADVQVKFDNRSTADKMKLSDFSDGGDAAYISSFQYSGSFEYHEFLERLGIAKKVSLQLSFQHGGEHWITFSLTDSTAALTAIGAL